MNRKQRVALLAAIVAIALAGLFPPWTVVDKQQNPQGQYYGFIIQEANQVGAEGVMVGGTMWMDMKPRLNNVMLYSEWAMIVLMAAGFVLYFQDKRS